MILRKRFAVLIVALSALMLSISIIPRLGTEFIPVLEEGVIQINVTMAPSISLEKATETVMRIERKIKEFDEVEMTIAKIGRPETGSHPHPVNTAHIQIALKSFDMWKNHSNKAELVESLNNALSGYPGVQLNFSQPISSMFDELLSGIKTQLAVTLFGEDLTVLKSKAQEIKEVISPVKGLVDLLQSRISVNPRYR